MQQKPQEQVVTGDRKLSDAHQLFNPQPAEAPVLQRLMNQML